MLKVYECSNLWPKLYILWQISDSHCLIWFVLSKFLVITAEPLTISVTPNDGTKVRISFKVRWLKGNTRALQNDQLFAVTLMYFARISIEKIHLIIFILVILMVQGSPGSFTEDAALKAYPNCETIPCDEFEEAFKV